MSLGVFSSNMNQARTPTLAPSRPPKIDFSTCLGVLPGVRFSSSMSYFASEF